MGKKSEKIEKNQEKIEKNSEKIERKNSEKIVKKFRKNKKVSN